MLSEFYVAIYFICFGLNLIRLYPEKIFLFITFHSSMKRHQDGFWVISFFFLPEDTYMPVLEYIIFFVVLTAYDSPLVSVIWVFYGVVLITLIFVDGYFLTVFVLFFEVIDSSPSRSSKRGARA